MKKFILIISMALSGVLLANAQRRTIVVSPAKRIIECTHPVTAIPVAKVAVVKPGPIVVVKPALRKRIVVIHN